MQPTALRKTTVEVLALLVDRYPNISIGQLLSQAAPKGVGLSTDLELAQGLNQLHVSLSQLKAAGLI